MITDALLQVASSQAVTTSAVSEDSVDLGVARDIGAGKQLYAVFTCEVAATSGGAPNIEFEMIVASDAALTTAIQSVGTSGVYLKAAIVIGKQVVVAINPILQSLGARYLGARFNASVALTAGTFTVDIVESISDIKSYTSGFTVTE